ncbi:hypothetical protein L7F22_022646 [Adiantum nelumboides]|nr:hypothetical protein [Adiantum nelumboides]
MADNNIDVFKMFAIEDRLDGDSYPMWAYMMQHVLVSKGVWNIMQGIDVRPGSVDVAKVVDVAGPPTRITAARSVLPIAEQARWDVKDAQAHASIALYTPQQNGVAERKNWHIAEVACALMSEKNMPPCYWAEAASIVVYTMNRTPTAVVHDMTPKEKFTKKKPNVSHFKVFGCIAYKHVPNELKTKLDLKAEKYVFIGYFVEQKGYKCYNPTTHQVRVSKDVVFDEMATWHAYVKDDIGAYVKNDIGADVNKSVAENSDAQSQVLSKPQGSPASSHVANPWSGRLRKEVRPTSSINVLRKGKEKVDEGMRMPTVGHDDADGHSSGSEPSLDEELGIPSIRTQGVRRLHAEKKAPSSNAKPHRSGRNRYLVDRLTYDGYVTKHFAFMAKDNMDEDEDKDDDDNEEQTEGTSGHGHDFDDDDLQDDLPSGIGPSRGGGNLSVYSLPKGYLDVSYGGYAFVGVLLSLMAHMLWHYFCYVIMPLTNFCMAIFILGQDHEACCLCSSKEL